jgi:hypothetical protein
MSPHITRLEKWIAPRALPLLAVISTLVLAGGVTAYFIVAHNFERVDRLERVIRCQHSATCRSFIYRAIREILEHEELKPQGKRQSDQKGVTFHLGPGDKNEAPILVEGTIPAQPSEPPVAQSPPKPSLPQGGGNHPEGGKTGNTPVEAAHEGSEAPESREPKSAPISPEGEAPSPPSATGSPDTAHVEPPQRLPTPSEAVQQVEEVICSALQEIHHLC